MNAATRSILVVVGFIVAVAAGAAVFLWWHHAPIGPRIFVANYKDDTVSVVDTGLERETSVLQIPDSPFALAVCAAPTPLVAVTNSTARRVTLIDSATLEIVGLVPVAKGPEFIACSPDGKRLYVTSPYENTITVVDVASRAALGDPIHLDKKPGAIAISPDGKRVYVAARDTEGAVLAINTDTRAVEASAPAGKFPSDVAVTTDGSRIVAASFDDSTITVIDAGSFKVLGTYQASTGTGLVLHPHKPLVYSMAGFDDTVDVLNYETGEDVGSIESAKSPTYSTITPDGRYLYVVNEDSSNLTKIDTETNKMVLRIAVGQEPGDAIFVDPGR